MTNDLISHPDLGKQQRLVTGRPSQYSRQTVVYLPDRDKAEIITLLDTSHGGNFDPSGHCSLSMLLQLIRAAPINSFPGQSLIKYWWPSQLLNKMCFPLFQEDIFLHKTDDKPILFKKCNFGFLSNPSPLILDCQVSFLWTIAKKFW